MQSQDKDIAKGKGKGKGVKLENENFMPRHSRLLLTEWVIGLVIYVGKVCMHACSC